MPVFDLHHLTQPDGVALAAARDRQQQLTKPPGSLGRLEDIGIWLAGWQGTAKPRAERVDVIIFAGNHGVVAEGISPFPAAVTAQMVGNFHAGGAAINALARAFGHELTVVPLDLDKPTGNIAIEPAMSRAETEQAWAAGAAAVAAADTPDILVLGEMGIGNTTIAAVLAAALFGGAGADWAGAGTGLDANGVHHKATIIDRALALHQPAGHPSAGLTTIDLLSRLGGREQAAMAGAIIEARRRRIPVILDGFVVTAAAAVLTRDAPDALAHCLAGHVSAERAHAKLLRHLALTPLLDLGMRLGEGSGAALATQIVRAAAATQSHMATFAEAGVSGSEGA
jgi:nicotinate-nucleotide--dimethylbenzimidazole phosphoribosyltransferase